MTVCVNVVLMLAVAFLCVSCGYLLLLTMMAAFPLMRRESSVGFELSLIVVVPAHNESGQIAETVDSILRSDYTSSRRRVLVLADNCDDDTAEVARQAGALVVERCDPTVRGKGQALNWLFTTRRDVLADVEGVVIVDADTQIDRQFLRQVSASLSEDGVRAVQGYYGVSNIGEGWRPALMEAALAVFHHLRPLGRTRLGGSAGLRGNGMAFDVELIRETGWPAFSIVEDIEFTIELLFRGVLVHYNPRAAVGGEMTSGSSAAKTQRSRWEGGRFGLLRTYGWRLLKQSFGRNGWRYADALLDLLVPPLAMLVLLCAGFLLLSLAVGNGVLTGLLVACLAVVAVYVPAGLLLRGEPWEVWAALLRAPFFVLWKIPLYAKMLISRQGERWIRTPRRGEQDGGRKV